MRAAVLVLGLVGAGCAQPAAPAGRRRAVWWVTKGAGPAVGPTDLEFVRAHRHAVTGVAPCCGCWGIGVGGNLTIDEENCGHFGALSGDGLDVLPQGWPTLAAVLGGGYSTAIGQLAAFAQQSNWSGVHTDLEPMGASTPLPTRQAYGRFVSELAVAFAAQGMTVKIDSGTGTVREWAPLLGAPGVMTMGTYWSRLSHGVNFTKGVLHKLAAALAPQSCARASVGIGVMLDAAAEPNARRQYNWTQDSLRTMLGLVGEAGLCEVAVYTNPMDNSGANSSWTQHTASWYIEEIAAYLKQ